MLLFQGNFDTLGWAATSTALWIGGGLFFGTVMGWVHYRRMVEHLEAGQADRLTTTYTREVSLLAPADVVFDRLRRHLTNSSEFTLDTHSAEFGSLSARRKRLKTVLGERVDIAIRETADGADVHITSAFISPTLQLDDGVNHGNVHELLDMLVTEVEVKPLQRERIRGTSPVANGQRIEEG